MRFKFTRVKRDGKHKKSYQVWIIKEWPLMTGPIGNVFFNEKFQKWTATKPVLRFIELADDPTGYQFYANQKIGSFEKRRQAAQRLYELTVIDRL